MCSLGRACLILAVLGPSSVALGADVVAPRKARRPGLQAKATKGHGVVSLNGVPTLVHWSDGDSFTVKSGAYAGRGTRLVGFNTLEKYGPVHWWGDWTPEALYQLARDAGPFAAAGAWNCTTDGRADGYGRLLVLCPDLAVEMVRQGYAMAYAVDGGAPVEGTLAAQAEAMAQRRGIWAKGRVHGVVTSVHSLGEDGSRDAQAYNRVLDTRTGVAHKRAHAKTYATCEWVCEVTDGETSCMRYVPFANRYRHRPWCLKAPPPGEPEVTARAAAFLVEKQLPWGPATSARKGRDGTWRVEFAPGGDATPRALRVDPARGTVALDAP
jgi:endonuclease YncB( thermonuclease family)